MTKPQAFMKDLKVDFVSLVDKGANKKRFAMFKSVQGKNKDQKKEEVKKMPFAMGSSFSDALVAIETEEEMEKSRDLMEEYFFILKTVMRGVLEDDTIENKTSGLKKAITEFRDATTELFTDLTIQKASEILGIGGNDMSKINTATQVVEKKGSMAGGGFSSNGVPEAKNRKGDQIDVDGVSKKKLRKAELEKLIKNENLEMETVLKGGISSKESRDLMKNGMALVEGWEVELVEIEKAVGDRTEEAPSTGINTVAEGVTDETQPQTAAFNEVAGVAKAETVIEKTETETEAVEESAPAGEPVEKAIGDAPKPTPSVAAKHNVSLDGEAISGMVEKFKKTMEVALDGKLGSMKDLLKTEMEAVIDEKLSGIQKDVSAVTKMAGVSNGVDIDFDNEAEQNRDKIVKEDDALWASELDGFGSLSSKTK